MPKLKKRVASSAVLHAALVNTDPSSIDLILVSPADYRAAFRYLPLRLAPRLTRAGRATPPVCDSRARAPAWRRRCGSPRKSPLLTL